MRRRSGYVLLEWIIGILFIVFGIYSYIRPDNMLTGIVILYGVIAIVSGIADILFYIRTERYTGFGPTICLISGIFSIMAGFMLAVYPNAGKWILVLLLPVWFIAHCVSRLTHLNYGGGVLLLFDSGCQCGRDCAWLSDDSSSGGCAVFDRLSYRHIFHFAGCGLHPHCHKPDGLQMVN